MMEIRFTTGPVSLDRNVCSICLTSSSVTYALQTRWTKHLATTVCSNMSLELSDKSRVCDKCFCKLLEQYRFKMKCLATEEQVKQEVIRTGRKIYSDNILLERNMKATVVIAKSCRLCLVLCVRERYWINVVDHHIHNCPVPEIINFCLPEINLDATYNPVLCPQCSVGLMGLYYFTKLCLETERKIHDYLTHTPRYDAKEDKVNLLIKVLLYWKKKDHSTSFYEGQLIGLQFRCGHCPFKNVDEAVLIRHKLIKHGPKDCPKVVRVRSRHKTSKNLPIAAIRNYSLASYLCRPQTSSEHFGIPKSGMDNVQISNITRPESKPRRKPRKHRSIWDISNMEDSSEEVDNEMA